MNKEICDYYEPTNRKSDKLCKHFIGDKNKQNQIDKCRYHCSIIDCSDCMQERSYIRHKGAIKQR